ncbi:MAG: peptidyl-prolyl cis-trans isomerase [Verrucomicrobiota bacterium]|jgi:parvulin-like peptidyl-prolyl isomerase
MSRRLRLWLLMVVALLLGLAASELLWRSFAFRDLAGRLFGRGHLVSIVQGKGIYETNLGENEPSAAELVVLENLGTAAANEVVALSAVDREVALLEAQFGNEKTFRKALLADGLSISALRDRATNQLRGLAWLEKQIRPATAVTEKESREFYEAHRDLLAQPVRFRGSHLFLAAHAETPPELVEEKERGIATFATRLRKGETLSALATEASEDEASKPRGGDLGYFSDTRMPPEFIAEIKKLRVGETSKPFRSHLGFHIAQVTEIRAAHLLPFEEARPEISVALSNGRRVNRVDEIAKTLARPD